MKYVKFTTTKGGDVFLPDDIVLAKVTWTNYEGGSTLLSFKKSDYNLSTLYVKETPRQVLEMLNWEIKGE